MLKITCVVNDKVLPGSGLKAEHGLAFWINTDTGSILLDTGDRGDVLCHNLSVLDLKPPVLKALAISHAHHDHTGGLLALSKCIPPGLPLYANADLLRARFSQRNGKICFVGLPVNEQGLRENFTMHLDDKPQQILPGVWTTGAIIKRPYPMGSSKHHFIQDDDKSYIADAYYDDLSLVIEVRSGLAVLCGCCHAGLLNTLEHIQRTFDGPIVFIAGGTHLGSADDGMLSMIAQTIDALGTVRSIYLNHCSGDHAYHALRVYLGDEIVHPCPAGTIIDFEDDLRD